MLCDVVRRRRWAHAPVIHAASHCDYKKRVAWVPISMHTCGSFFFNYGAPLDGPSQTATRRHHVATSFPGSLFSASLGRWKKDLGCSWSHDHPESFWVAKKSVWWEGWQSTLVDVTNFVGFKSSGSR